MDRVVYDSMHGRMCPRCRKPQAKCRCAEQMAAARPVGDGIVRVRREVRNGKTLTVVLGVQLAEAPLRELGKQLKQACGTGGTVKDGAIEIQGDHRERIVTLRQGAGYEVKLAGG
ncbi:MAG TPA: stress response translation initiation inhibitor YciH [Planctomycetota bacterium]|nr:stress response translation initiation inhibitor YciH [Planctomycetota bacterium]